MEQIHYTMDMEALIGICLENQNTIKKLEAQVQRLNQKVDYLGLEVEAMNGMVSDMDIDDRLKEIYPEVYR